MSNEDMDNETMEAIEDVLGRTGMSLSDCGLRKCELDEPSEHEELMNDLRSDLLRRLFLEGVIENTLLGIVAEFMKIDLERMFLERKIARDTTKAFAHAYEHTAINTANRIVRDAIEPFVAALDDQGKWGRRPDLDFRCIMARIASDIASD